MLQQNLQFKTSLGRGVSERPNMSGDTRPCSDNADRAGARRARHQCFGFGSHSLTRCMACASAPRAVPLIDPEKNRKKPAEAGPLLETAGEPTSGSAGPLVVLSTLLAALSGGLCLLAWLLVLLPARSQ